MTPQDDIRGYLSRRIAFLITDIDKCYSEINYITQLLRASHSADVDTVPPTRFVGTPEFPPHPAVRPPPLRPKLNPSKSSPDIRAWPDQSAEQHAGLRPAVASQSRYPEFTRSELKS